jgi:uncharacterized protein (TIGR03435 family)
MVTNCGPRTVGAAYIPKSCRRPAVQGTLVGLTLLVSAIGISAHLRQDQGGRDQSTFDVSSIRQNTDLNARTNFDMRGVPGGTVNITAVTLGEVIRLAWGGLRVLRPYQVIGGPAWMNEVRFNIAAKFHAIDEKSTPSNDRFAPPDRVAQMLRNLLKERFALRVREERRNLPVYVLLPVRSDRRGPSIAASTVTCDGSVQPANGECILRSGPEGFSGQGVGLDQLVDILPYVSSVGRPVVDRTGWTGRFDFSLNFSQVFNPLGSPNAISIFTALKDQLGLKLEPGSEPYPVIVIEHADMPTPN